MESDVARIGFSLLPPLGMLVVALIVLQRNRSPYCQSVVALIVGSFVALSTRSVLESVPEGLVSLGAVLLGVRIVSIVLLCLGMMGVVRGFVTPRQTSLRRHFQRAD